jgi:hypothetical protein
MCCCSRADKTVVVAAAAAFAPANHSSYGQLKPHLTTVDSGVRSHFSDPDSAPSLSRSNRIFAHPRERAQSPHLHRRTPPSFLSYTCSRYARRVSPHPHQISFVCGIENRFRVVVADALSSRTCRPTAASFRRSSVWTLKGILASPASYWIRCSRHVTRFSSVDGPGVYSNDHV